MAETVEVRDVPCTIRALIQDPDVVMIELDSNWKEANLALKFESPVWIELILYNSGHQSHDLTLNGLSYGFSIKQWKDGLVYVFVDWIGRPEKDIFLHPEKFVGVEIQVSELGEF